MSLTYPDARPEPQPIVPEMRSREAEPYTPVYARRPARRKGKVKSWMVLAPVGALTVAAIGAWAIMNPGEQAAEPAAAEPAPLAAPPLNTPAEPVLTEAAGPESAVIQPPAEAAPEPVVAAPAPTARTARAEPAPSPAQRAAEPEAAEPALPEGPQAYEAVVAAENSATIEVAEPAEPAPLIVVEPN